MKIVIAQPPNLAEIDRVFPNRGQGVVYAFGDTIYNPGNVKIPRSIIAHEAAHGLRQQELGKNGVEHWWRSYLDDPEFRYREEVIGHAAEYLAQVNGHYDRNANARLLMTTAVRLLASFYGYGKRFTHKQAVNDLRQEAHRMSK
jgi:hypothetical protein